jgi:hypothetical protein
MHLRSKSILSLFVTILYAASAFAGDPALLTLVEKNSSGAQTVEELLKAESSAQALIDQRNDLPDMYGADEPSFTLYVDPDVTHPYTIYVAKNADMENSVSVGKKHHTLGYSTKYVLSLSTYDILEYRDGELIANHTDYNSDAWQDAVEIMHALLASAGERAATETDRDRISQVDSSIPPTWAIINVGPDAAHPYTVKLEHDAYYFGWLSVEWNNAQERHHYFMDAETKKIYYFHDVNGQNVEYANYNVGTSEWNKAMNQMLAYTYDAFPRVMGDRQRKHADYVRATLSAARPSTSTSVSDGRGRSWTIQRSAAGVLSVLQKTVTTLPDGMRREEIQRYTYNQATKVITYERIVNGVSQGVQTFNPSHSGWKTKLDAMVFQSTEAIGVSKTARNAYDIGVIRDALAAARPFAQVYLPPDAQNPFSVLVTNDAVARTITIRQEKGTYSSGGQFYGQRITHVLDITTGVITITKSDTSVNPPVTTSFSYKIGQQGWQSAFDQMKALIEKSLQRTRKSLDLFDLDLTLKTLLRFQQQLL